MNPRIARFLAGGAAAAILAGTAGATALAQSAPATPPARPAVQRADDFLNALAAKLGKTPDEVRSAARAAEHDLVNKALVSGRITKQQADRLNERIDKTNGLPLRGGPGLGKAPARPGKVAAPATLGRGELARFLGVQPKELATELKSGKSLAQVAQAHGKTVDQLKTFLRDQAKTRLDSAVKNGRMTQAQADAALKKLTDGLDKLVNRVPKVKAKKAAA